jgi:hypothetical protein
MKNYLLGLMTGLTLLALMDRYTSRVWIEIDMAGIDLKGRAKLVVEEERVQVAKTLSDIIKGKVAEFGAAQMEQESIRSAEEAAQIRESMGVTRSLGPEDRMVDVTDTEMGQLSSPEPLVEMAEQVREPSFEKTEISDPSRATSPRPMLRPTESDEDRVLPLFVPEDVQQDTGFMSSVKTASDNLGIPSEELLRAMHFETGGTFSTSIKNPTGSATGLIQFIESTAESLGTSTAELAKMTREEQMQYVEKYLTPYKGRMKDFGDIYMAIHLPVAVGKSDDYVIYDNESLRTQAYKQNRGLDTNNDGKVTKGEAVTRASRDTQ